MSLLCAGVNGLGCIILGSSVDNGREGEDVLRPKIGCGGGAVGSDDLRAAPDLEARGKHACAL
jgi:hypothetical protein